LDLEGDEKWRARQNVILELGWFMAKLGRHRVVILYKGSTEIPSDLLGVVYLRFQTSIFEVSEKIRQRLSGAGLLP
jgi:predicted nucleotide-binding protein